MNSPIPGVTYPQPRTWSAGDPVTVPRLRGDLYNMMALTIGGAVPLLRATSQSGTAIVGHGTVFFNEQQVNTWNVNVVGTAFQLSLYQVPLSGYYLAEGFNTFGPVSGAANARYTVGFTYTQNGTLTNNVDGSGYTGSADSAYIVPSGAELSQLNTATNDGVGLYSYNTGAASVALTSSIMVSWVGLPTSGLSGYTGPYGTKVSSPQPAALYPPGEGTTLTAGMVPGATGADVASNTGIVTGMTIGLGYMNGLPVYPQAETVTVTSVSPGGALGISATQYGHSTGDPVAVPLSAAFLNQQVRDAVNFLAYPPMCRAYATTAQTISNNASTQITNLTANIDTFSGFASNTYTIPVSGLYYVYGQVYWNGSTANTNYAVALDVGGSSVWGTANFSASSSGNQAICIPVRRLLRLTSGTQIQLFGYQDSGSSMATIANIGAAIETSRLIVIFRAF